MTYLFYTNSSESTQLFVGIILIISIIITMSFGIYFSISDFIKKRNGKSKENR